MPAGDELVARLAEVGRALLPTGATDALEVLADHDGTAVVAVGDVVVKAHRADAAPTDVAERAAIAARVPELLTPLVLPDAGVAPYVAVMADRAVTAWPRGVPVDRDDPDAAPWAETGALVARLHRQPVALARGLTARGPDRVARALIALRALEGGPDVEAVLAAAATLEPWTYAAAPWPTRSALVHGDLHLGQLLTPPTAAGLVLLDVDDVGLGDPVWDLARPAAWFLTGMVHADEWSSFLGAYAAADGPATADGRDPWPALEPVARALTVQMAARVLVRAHAAGSPSDTPAQWLVEACRRIVAVDSIPAPP